MRGNHRADLLFVTIEAFSGGLAQLALVDILLQHFGHVFEVIGREEGRNFYVHLDNVVRRLQTDGIQNPEGPLRRAGSQTPVT